MATEFIQADINVLRAILVDRPAALSEILPILNVGQVVRFAVKANPENGKGVIFLSGQMLEATLPKSIKPGDQVVAKIAHQNDQVILQILERDRPVFTPGGSSAQVVTELVKQLQNFSSASLRTATPFPFVEQYREVLQQRFNSFLAVVPNTEKLANPRETLAHLLASANGTLAEPLRELANLLRGAQDEVGNDPALRVLVALRNEFQNFLQKSVTDNKISAKQLTTLISVLTKELEGNVSQESKLRPALSRALDNLKSVNQGQPNLWKQELQKIFSELDDVTKRSAGQFSSSTRAVDLQSVIGRLETMASTQESLTQINPLMHALGEPALILFPFLAQGLITHSQVTIQPRAGRSNGEDSEDQEGEDGGGGHEKDEPYQRIQVNVPLPNLGPIGVDIAHRKKEILVRLNVESSEVATFLLDQLENLALVLKQQGFEKAELVAHVGGPATGFPHMSVGIQSGRSLLA